MLIEALKLTSTGVDFDQFAVGLNHASFPEAAQFVAREKELSKMHELLYRHSSRSCVSIVLSRFVLAQLCCSAQAHLARSSCVSEYVSACLQYYHLPLASYSCASGHVAPCLQCLILEDDLGRGCLVSFDKFL
jgi:hypothetical protein